MNKLVIIGNGFDLAHNLPTSYKHFINYFWTNLKDSSKDEIISRVVYINDSFDGFLRYDDKPITCYIDVRNNMIKYANDYGGKFDIGNNTLVSDNRNGNVDIFKFSNYFFKIITLESIENWVDIENIYYEILKHLVKNTAHVYGYPNSIETLNQEFEDVKNLLEDYIKSEVLDKFDFTKEPENVQEILRLFKIRPLYLETRKDHSFLSEFPPEDHDELVKYDKIVVDVCDSYSNNVEKNILWPEALFLDFNYTKTGESYSKLINLQNNKDYGSASHIQIHGKIKSDENQINFGFGDEMDEDYKIIERTGKNAYLKNIKSFQYLHTSNYRKLLNWIETNKFQVFIFGHSCGLSDRTLLNTIFENNNCRSIKIFYHQREVDNNYTELTQNISRHFNKKALMRTKIVNKTLCEKLDQTVRFKEKK